MFNTPLPMLLAWGEQQVVLCNEAYGALAGPGQARVPGGVVPAVLPPPFAAAGEALAAARRGEPACVRGAQLEFGGEAARFDLYFTPLGGGVLCTLGPATEATEAAQAQSAELCGS